MSCQCNGVSNAVRLPHPATCTMYNFWFRVQVGFVSGSHRVMSRPARLSGMLSRSRPRCRLTAQVLACHQTLMVVVQKQSAFAINRPGCAQAGETHAGSGRALSPRDELLRPGHHAVCAGAPEAPAPRPHGRSAGRCHIPGSQLRCQGEALRVCSTVCQAEGLARLGTGHAGMRGVWSGARVQPEPGKPPP